MDADGDGLRRRWTIELPDAGADAPPADVAPDEPAVTMHIVDEQGGRVTLEDEITIA